MKMKQVGGIRLQILQELFNKVYRKEQLTVDCEVGLIIHILKKRDNKRK